MRGRKLLGENQFLGFLRLSGASIGDRKIGGSEKTVLKARDEDRKIEGSKKTVIKRGDEDRKVVGSEKMVIKVMVGDRKIERNVK
ncbi:hypothetical protein [Alkalihalobacterium chitinilyticum]|uniref:Uncharacterized protein n=1 Tax=Alkalihalobacterium chitinilyticum TaxID=2980103 RepID=A0ABT5VE26_9BACI|nr:hypothetical protein [Alkalihalobacterium chitinilyticum]MDE5413386.1 hypothetical protein [Alkalihalobacterium chitinilyticum]